MQFYLVVQNIIQNIRLTQLFSLHFYNFLANKYSLKGLCGHQQSGPVAVHGMMNSQSGTAPPFVLSIDMIWEGAPTHALTGLRVRNVKPVQLQACTDHDNSPFNKRG